MLGAGQGAAGWRRCRRASSFFGPQLGCRWRAVSKASNSRGGVCVGEWYGRRERSMRLRTPLVLKRMSHL